VAVSSPDQFVSTGSLPAPDQVQGLVDEAHLLYRDLFDGANSAVYPALQRVDPGLFGICVASVGGRLFTAGDVEVEFPVMSVAKPFVFALVCEALGPETARDKLGVNATGLPFNSPEAVERSRAGLTNPMVNPGAIATTSLVAGATAEERWTAISSGLSRFAGRALVVDEEVYRSASATNLPNRAITELLESSGAIYSDSAETLDLYTRACSVAVTARDLAVMAATLADGGVNPCTGEEVVSASTCRYVLTVMTTAGLYETSGDWLYDVGLPGKSGIGGGILTVSPGKGGLGVFSPPLDMAGNSVRGRLVAAYLSQRLGFDLFASMPVSGA
jgi:glutaminase